MFQNLLVSPITPLRKTDEINNWENTPFTTVWPEPRPCNKERKETEYKRRIQKKSKRFRTAFTTEQVRALEKTFANSRYIEPKSRMKLAESLKISDKAIKVWFQNRRMKEKRDESLESSTESFASSPLNNLEAPVTVKPDYLEVHSDIPGLTETPPNLESAQEYVPQRPTSEHWFPPETAKNHEIMNHFSYYQAPDDYGPQYPGNMMSYQMPYSFAYDTNVYPTEYYPNEQYGNERDYFEGDFTPQQPDYTNGYALAAYNFDY